MKPYYAKSPSGEKYIGMDSEIAKKYFDRLKFINKTTEIAPEIFLVPEIKKESPILSSNQVLFVKENEELVRDYFEHELFMVVEEDDTLIVFSGCGHIGIRNIVSTTKESFPHKKNRSCNRRFSFSSR